MFEICSVYFNCSVFIVIIDVITGFLQLPNNVNWGYLVAMIILCFIFQLSFALWPFLFIYLLVLTVWTLSFTYLDDFFIFNESILNPLLVNSLVSIHPLLYVGTLYLYVSFIFLLFLFPHILLFRLLIIYNMLFVYLFICLFLGCWWAFQETYWGGWWFWEVSEFLIIFFIILILFSLHSNNTLCFLSFFYSILTCLVALFLYTRSLEIFFEVTLHSFFFSKSAFKWRYSVLLVFFYLPLIFLSHINKSLGFSYYLNILLFFVYFKTILISNFLFCFTFILLTNQIRGFFGFHSLLFAFYFILLFSSFYSSPSLFVYTPTALLWLV